MEVDLSKIDLFMDQLDGQIGHIAQAAGLPTAGLKIFIGILAGQPLALIYRYALSSNQVPNVIKHLYFTITGSLILFFCYRKDILHFYASVLISYLFMWILGPTKLSVGVVFSFIMSYLLIGYVYTATADYDINWTTSHCVLTLRVIGFAWDYYDGGMKKKKEDALSKDQLTTCLEELPGVLETFGFFLSFGGLLTGPQYPYRKYDAFITNDIYRVQGFSNVKSCLDISAPFFYASVRFAACIFYIVLYTVLSGKWNIGLIKDAGFVNLDFATKIFYMWIVGWVLLKRYLLVWLMAESACITLGLGFNGYEENYEPTKKNKPIPKWNGAANMRLTRFEFANQLGACITSFNINTNQWSARYVFKRLRFLGNKNLSAGATLFFLAIWHGFDTGYFVCFFFEFLVMEFERVIIHTFGPMTNDVISKSVILKGIHYVFTWSYKSIFLSYALISFELLKWDEILRAYNSVYWFPHLVCVVFLGMSASGLFKGITRRNKQDETTVKSKEDKKRK
eukprot:Nk52_evm41s292 gene=Nk52_evmTU41s292